MRGPRKLGALKEFLTFSFDITLLATFFGVLTLSSPEGLFEITNNTTNQSSSQVGSQGSNNNCSTCVGVPNEEVSGNEADIRCLQKVLEKCRPFDATLDYGLGSMSVLIKGLTNAGGNNCSLSLVHEIERGVINTSSMIPITKSSTWTNWKRGDGFDAVDQISNYCVR